MSQMIQDFWSDMGKGPLVDIITYTYIIKIGVEIRVSFIRESAELLKAHYMYCCYRSQ